jgi:hypothetical protein
MILAGAEEHGEARRQDLSACTRPSPACSTPLGPVPTESPGAELLAVWSDLILGVIAARERAA